MKRISVLLFLCASFCLSSCVATMVAGAAVGVVGAVAKGTVKGVGWAVSKTSSAIDEDKLDGKWKVIGVFTGSYDDLLKNSQGEDIFSSQCGEGNEVIVFKSNKSKLQPVHCSSDKVAWEKYKLNFGKNPVTKEKENYLQLANNTYISIIHVEKKKMILEGNLMPVYGLSGGNVYLLEKVK